MVPSTPDLASLDRAGEISDHQEEIGANRLADAASVQMQVDLSSPSSPSSPTRPIPKSFIWRLYGGRSSSSSNSLPLTEAPNVNDVNDMAVMVDVPVLRDSFDPWGHHHHEKDLSDDEQCKGCSRIARARAAMAHLPVSVRASVPLPDRALASHARSEFLLPSVLSNQICSVVSCRDCIFHFWCSTPTPAIVVPQKHGPSPSSGTQDTHQLEVRRLQVPDELDPTVCASRGVLPPNVSRCPHSGALAVGGGAID
ncbi:hypothetical protein B0H63DRAFT_523696 [Podospora didyma]|uniref:Uncharacterized protein n=1 Tax=Podospora didyma TaxID=330526 RepID=A0AAE0NG74_9PEZI|nr:hypothetical protein B0H63DRAFT_523696 [Podospora didyma]